MSCTSSNQQILGAAILKTVKISCDRSPVLFISYKHASSHWTHSRAWPSVYRCLHQFHPVLLWDFEVSIRAAWGCADILFRTRKA